MGGQKKELSPYEKITLLTLPEKVSSNDQVLADFEKLDLSGSLLDSEYPAGDINHNDGQDKKSNPFHKLCKFYGRNKDVFQFVETLRDEKFKSFIMNRVSEKSGNDSKVISEFGKNMKTFLNRISGGETEAEAFLDDSELAAFFHGNHVNRPGHPRNIHENLNINVTSEKKTLEVGNYFEQATPLMTAEKSELKRVKVFANGQRLAAGIKEDGVKNYIFNKQGDMDLEIGWVANYENRNLFCEVSLKACEGKLLLNKATVDGGPEYGEVLVVELAKQNEQVLVKGKKLHAILEKLVIQRMKQAAMDLLSIIQPNAKIEESKTAKSRETLTIQQVPIKAPKAEHEILADFGKLEFTPGPFSATDEINFNDGLDANPFDKIAKLYGCHKDVFLFNSMLNDVTRRAEIMEIVERKCNGLEKKADLLSMFKKRMEIYLKRISGGSSACKQVIGEKEGMQGFFHGYYVAKKGNPQNPHQNLNVNVSQPGQVLNTSQVFHKKAAGIEAESRNLERVKIYGNGRRLMNVVKGGNGQRNYCFSKLAKMELDIEWVTREDVTCRLILEIKGGQLAAKLGSINGVVVNPVDLLELANENDKVLLRGMCLRKVLEDIAGNRADYCHSQEYLRIGKLGDKPSPLEESEVLGDFEKLKLSDEQSDPTDKLNWNDGLKAHPFEKLRKFYGRSKNIFVLISALRDPGQLEKILDIVKRKCGDDVKTVAEFKHRINLFLDRVEMGRTNARMFLCKEQCKDMDALFAGYHFPGGKEQRRNIHANLHMDLSEWGNKGFDLAALFGRETPNYKQEKGELQNVKIFGNGKKVLKVSKTDWGQKNYMYTKWADEIKLEIRWKVGDMENAVILNICKGKVSVPGVTPEMVNLAKQNDKVLLRNKKLHEVLQQCMKKNKKSGQTEGEAIVEGRDPEAFDSEDFVILSDDGNAGLKEETKNATIAEDFDGDD